MREEQYIVIVDDDKHQWGIAGPTADDTRWTDRVWAEQQRGRNIRCYTTPGTSEEDVARGAAERHKGTRVRPLSLPGWGPRPFERR